MKWPSPRASTSDEEAKQLRVDSHQHFWRYSPEGSAWIDDSMRVLRRDFLPTELAVELKRAGVAATVAVQVGQSLAETRFLLEQAEQHDFVRGVVGWVDLRATGVATTLAELAENPRFKGVRHIVQGEPSGFLADAAFRAGVASLARFDLSYDVLVYARQLPEAVDFVRALPDVRFVLNHLAKPEIRAGRLEPWREHMRRLAELPNVSCKLSGLITEAAWHAWTPSDLAPFIDAAVESFGPSRLLVGSDWPVCTLAGSYAAVMRVFDDYFAGFSVAERAQVFGETAARVYRLSEPTACPG
jgi:L-fuconolactonase